MSYKIRALWLMLASVIGTAYSFAQPDDIVADAWVLDISGRPMPAAFGPGTVWDLSDAPIERMAERRWRWYGDTVHACISEGRKEWYAAVGDTVWSLGSSDRMSVDLGLCGIPCFYPCSGSGREEACDSVRSARSLFSDAMRLERGSASSFLSGAIALPSGDTIADARCFVVQRVDSASVREARWWRAPGCPLPVVEMRRTVLADGTAVGEELAICPPSEQPTQAPVFRSPLRDAQGAPRADFGDGCAPLDVEASISGESLSCRSRDGSRLAEWRLCDAWGRAWLRSPGSETASLGPLPSGTYVLWATDGERTAAVKVAVERRTP